MVFGRCRLVQERCAIATNVIAELLLLGRAESENAPGRGPGRDRLGGFRLPLPNHGLDG